MKRKILLAVSVLMLMCLFGGCSTRTIDEMYSLPRRSAKNNNLRTVIESSMEGRVYAAPISGENQESVQTVDLNGDGNEEFLIFTKSEKDDTLQILLFRQLPDDAYELWETIDCKGSAFEQVQYAEIDDTPGRELIVGTQLNEKVTRTASIYAFSSGHSVKIKSMIYVKFIMCDLNSDGKSELMVIQNGENGSYTGVVRLYSYQDGEVTGSNEAPLSVSPEHVRRLAVNMLADQRPAVYVASSSSQDSMITDIFALKNDVFTNISRSGDYGTSMQTLRNNFIYAEDLDGDGILELPNPVQMRHNTTNQYMLRWFSMDSNAQEIDKLYTFHNVDNGWYIVLDSDWTDRFAAEKNGNTYTFFMWNNSYGTAVPVFAVYALTEKDRDIQAAAQNRFALHRGEEVVYAAKLETGSALYGITESYLQANFHLIHQNWNNSEA